MAAQYNMAEMTVTGTPGTGNVTLNAANAPFITFANAGVQNGDVLTVWFRDGNNAEVSEVTYSSSGPTLSGRTVLVSTNSNALVSLTSSAVVGIVTTAFDNPDPLLHAFCGGL